MRGHDSAWIVNRIIWCANKHNLPSGSTGFWDDATGDLKEILPTDFTQPVIYSGSNDGHFAVIGVDEICVVGHSIGVRVNLDDITDISQSGFTGDKLTLCTLSLTCSDGSKYIIPTEPGKSCYAIWGILNLLVRIKNLG